MKKFYKSNSSKFFQFLAILILSTLCLLLNQLTQINFRKIELPKNKPQYNAKGANGKVFDRSGKLLYSMKSATAWEYPSDDRIYLESLNLLVYNESSNAVKYDLTSDYGWINHITKIGFLGLNTHVIVENSDPTQVVDLYGSNVDLDLDKNLFSSSYNVKAVQNDDIITSHGFSYDSARKLLKLNDNVHITYTPRAGTKI